jgi:hypothetical protein
LYYDAALASDSIIAKIQKRSKCTYFYLLGLLANKLGWESVFYVFGVLGIVWFLFWWWLVYDTPQSHPTITRQEKEYILRSLGNNVIS